MPHVSVKDVDQQKFTVAMSAFLKKSGKLSVPSWTEYCKTNVAKELSPYDADWYYTRAASTLRHLYVRSNVGSKTFAKIYGVRQNNGTCPSHYRRGSTNIPRKIMQGLEAMKLVEKSANG